MKSAGETAEGLKDEPIIFQFFPRESSQQRGAVPGTVGSWQLARRSPPSVLQTHGIMGTGIPNKFTHL